METFFTKDHEWIRIDGKTGTIGITDYAQHQLGDITFVELPKVGKTVKKGGVLCSVESVKAASDIFAPLAGSVTEVNKKLDTEPQLANQKPESDGWIAKMELTDPTDRAGLLDLAKYQALTK